MHMYTLCTDFNVFYMRESLIRLMETILSEIDKIHAFTELNL